MACLNFGLIKKRTVMASLMVTPENQIQRLNVIMNQIQELKSLETVELLTPLNSKSWSVIEVIEHLNIAYQLYVDKINKALVKLPEKKNERTAFKVRWWPKLVVNSTQPKGGTRKMKIKTLKKFEPILPLKNLNREGIEEIFIRFQKLHSHLKNAILQSRSKDNSKLKIDSAIGPIVSFHLPECFEFLLAHMERHLLQIQEIRNSFRTN